MAIAVWESEFSRKSRVLGITTTNSGAILSTWAKQGECNYPCFKSPFELRLNRQFGSLVGIESKRNVLIFESTLIEGGADRELNLGYVLNPEGNASIPNFEP